jgi:hypothetical protein
MKKLITVIFLLLIPTVIFAYNDKELLDLLEYNLQKYQYFVIEYSFINKKIKDPNRLVVTRVTYEGELTDPIFRNFNESISINIVKNGVGYMVNIIYLKNNNERAITDKNKARATLTPIYEMLKK